MSLNLRVVENGVELPLRVSASASRDALLGEHGGALKISVTAAPEKGKANKAIIAFLAKTLDIPRKSLEIIRGETAPDKMVRIEGISLDDVLKKCAVALKK